MSSPYRFVLSLGFTALLMLQTGCDDDDDTQPSVQIRITEDNAREIAIAALTPVILFGELELQSIVSGLAQLTTNGVSQGPRVEVPQSEIPCDSTGVLYVSGNVIDPGLQVLNPGDSLTVRYDQCRLFTDVIVSGSLNLAVRSFSGASLQPPYTYTVELSSIELDVEEQREQRTLSGDAVFSTQTDDGTTFTSELAADAIGFVEAVSGDDVTLADLNVVTRLDLSTAAFTQDISGTLDSSSLDGIVEFATTSILRGFPAYPETGELEVYGRSESTLLITFLDSVDITLAVDEDGDGVPEAVTNVTRNELFPR